MQAPESVTTGLRNVRETFTLRWNHKGKVVGKRSFDVNGNPRELTYEPRWELWDMDVDGIVYKLMTLEDYVTGEFLPADDRFVEFVNLINPARYDGSVEKMIEALVDSQNDFVQHMAEKEFEALIDSVGSYYTKAKGKGIVTVL